MAPNTPPLDPVDSLALPLTLQHLCALDPPSTTRAWQSAPHPHLPLLATCSSDKTVQVYDLVHLRQHSVVGGDHDDFHHDDDGDDEDEDAGRAAAEGAGAGAGDVRGHQRSIRSVAWRPGARDGDSDSHGHGGRMREPVMLATGSFDATAGLWRYPYHHVTGRRTGPHAGSGPRRRRRGGQGGKSEEENEREREKRKTRRWRFSVLLEGHDSEIKAVAWSRSGRFLATCSRDKSVWIWLAVAPPWSGDPSRRPGGLLAAAAAAADAEGEGEGEGDDEDDDMVDADADDDDDDADADAEDEDFETVAVLQEHDGDVKCLAWHPTEDTLASGSYDDTIRLYRREGEDEGEPGAHADADDDDSDWICIAVLTGHQSTVWSVVFEPVAAAVTGRTKKKEEAEAEAEAENENENEARLLSASADQSIRVWRRQQRRRRRPIFFSAAAAAAASRYPSTIIAAPVPLRDDEAEADDGGDREERWVQQAVLPPAHDGPVYSVAWSASSLRVASAGGDGRVVVYAEEKGEEMTTTTRSTPRDKRGEGGDAAETYHARWRIIALLDAAHGVCEIGHVVWCRRWDGRARARARPRPGPGAVVVVERVRMRRMGRGAERGGGGTTGDDDDGGGAEEEEEEDEEEMLVSTGDDGVVNLWTLVGEKKSGGGGGGGGGGGVGGRVGGVGAEDVEDVEDVQMSLD
ncbi:MAG: Cytosolic iron-sulfur protein assembly protein [Phylliscum demangeonii]|nr:MAG: Cytosolic iron-sulfur protein assembly protein [Phylliscum demangeonii]